MVNDDLMLPSSSRAKMTTNSNVAFHHGIGSISSYNRSVVSYQPGAMSSMAGLTPTMMNSSEAFGGTMGMMMAGNPGLTCNGVMSNASPVVQAGSASTSILPEPVPGLRCDPGMAVVWSFEEQAILRDGLVKYAGLPTMMKYIKIAAMLREKTVRDVALRCRWMNRKENSKRRKPDEHHAGKKIKDRKEKVVDAFSSPNAQMIPSATTADYSLMTHQFRPNHRFLNEVPVIDAATQHLMDENAQFLQQIAANLASLKIGDNVHLFTRMRNNINAILNSMSKMPGIMSKMPAFPEPIKEELVNAIDAVNQAHIMLGPQGSFHSM